MLIRFSVENFLSFNNRTEFSMIAGGGTDLSHHIIRGEDNVDLLKAGVIYGANASGKSNLIKAMKFAQDLIMERAKPKQSIHRKYFKLADGNAKKPSRFEFEFRYKSRLYAYGFLFDSKDIHEEWLYLIGGEEEKRIFDRRTLKEGIIDFKLGDISLKEDDKKRIELNAKDTMPNQLFLTELNNRNVRDIINIEFLLDAYEWFDDVLIIIFPDSRFRGLEFRIKENHSMTDAFHHFFQVFDTGIEKLESVEVDVNSLNNDLPEKILHNLRADLEPGEKYIIDSSVGKSYAIYKNEDDTIGVLKLITQHKLKNDISNTISFDLEEESDGTRRLLDFIPMLDNLPDFEGVYVIDELDRSLHPNLSKKILDFFLNSNDLKPNQLIVTTHESSLLNLELLRRDEIWFVEKNRDGESSMYSLDEFEPVPYKSTDPERIRSGYLVGRYGGIPSDLLQA